ncbi:sulfatase-like hydrolase/transferase [Stratiformator vulcanicus]|uniref:Arylsulfatase n=1 Tax=Stratiformator vulcanicus TaxID=2527980 RepID=A0A517R1M5_9PLAN|nr:sulfatase-like hydrolase/transferase [Stratiformator vulcanicus]QDT37776.1 Arylsulfatase [Stratiformator vulcanicus]
MSVCIRFNFVIICVGALLGGYTSFAVAVDRPNVVLIVSDDQRVDTIAALGNEIIKTPHLDSLVQTGTTFENAYCQGSMYGAVCVSSRAMLLSGENLWKADKHLTGQTTLPEHFRNAGYATFGCGKWHNGRESFTRSFNAGGAIFFGGMSDHFAVPVHDFDPEDRYPKKSKRIGTTHSSELFADAAVSFLKGREDAEQPFFLYLAFTAPHDPRTPPAPYDTMYDPADMPLPPNFLPEHPFDNGEMKIRDEKLAEWPRTPEVVKEHLAAYYGMISHMDAQIGRVLKKLDESGERENTLIVFLSDHGLAIGSHGLMGKQNLYEHSMKAPLIFSGPGVAKNRRVDNLCYLHDVFSLVLTRADVSGRSVESHKLAREVFPPLNTNEMQRRLLRSRSDEAVPAFLREYRRGVELAYKDEQFSYRQGKWKIVVYPEQRLVQLFNLEADPNETTNLAGEKDAHFHLSNLWNHWNDSQVLFDSNSTKNRFKLALNDLKPAPDGKRP